MKKRQRKSRIFDVQKELENLKKNREKSKRRNGQYSWRRYYFSYSSRMDGNPSNKNGGGRKKRKLANLENEIHKRLVDQEEAVKIVAQHIKKRQGLD